jgi:hypothetical protein
MADLASQPTSVQSVYSWFREEKLFVNRRYQRKLVWTLEEKQKLIDSIVKKYPIPAILIAEREDAPGTYEIIDGLQRLHAIVSYIETTFPTADGKRFNLSFFPTAKSKADEGLFIPFEDGDYISQREVSALLDYNIALSVMRGATETEVNDVFDRINTYGHRLSDQERRQAGVQNEFSNMVRTIACTLRGDESADVLPLRMMPSISIDLPKSKHGYDVQADEVFWVVHGILRSTDLRDSMDEQCIADIAACIVGGMLVDRSKDALDEIYLKGSAESDRVNTALGVYGADKFADEFKFCVDEILKVCRANSSDKLRDLVFDRRTTNAFPSVFAALLIAFHELIVRDGQIIANYEGVKKSISNISLRIERGRSATSPDERRKNIDTVKGLIKDCFIAATEKPKIYDNHSTTDIDSAIRRSEVELANYELKQGLLTLHDKRSIDENVIGKVVKTVCAIANNGPQRVGKIIIGVTDKDSDAERIHVLDGVDPRKVGKRQVVGVTREAKALAITVESYLGKWKEGIKSSGLSATLRDGVLSSIDFNSYFGLGVIVITVPPQNELSYVDGEVYWRNGDSTELATAAKQIASLAKRF